MLGDYEIEILRWEEQTLEQLLPLVSPERRQQLERALQTARERLQANRGEAAIQTLFLEAKVVERLLMLVSPEQKPRLERVLEQVRRRLALLEKQVAQHRGTGREPQQRAA